jgi:hypothetical protein
MEVLASPGDAEPGNQDIEANAVDGSMIRCQRLEMSLAGIFRGGACFERAVRNERTFHLTMLEVD